MTSMLATGPPAAAASPSSSCWSVTLLLMAFSSNPAVRDVQNGIGFAFRPIQGALDSVAGGVASIGDGDRRDRPAAGRQRRAPRRERAAEAENARLEEIRARERAADRRSSSCAAGFDYRPTRRR